MESVSLLRLYNQSTPMVVSGVAGECLGDDPSCRVDPGQVVFSCDKRCILISSSSPRSSNEHYFV